MHIIVLNYVCVCIYCQFVTYFVHNQSQAREKERVITLGLQRKILIILL